MKIHFSIISYLDVSVMPAFKLKVINDGQSDSLWLIFNPALMEFRRRSGRYLKATKSLVETFFVIEQDYLFSENDEIAIQNESEPNIAENQDYMDIGDDESDDSDELPIKIIDDLYQQLREAHQESRSTSNYTDEFIQHKDLRPNLTHYQFAGVKWMLDREQVLNHFPTEFTEVFLRWPEADLNTKFFYNDRIYALVINKNEDVAIPSGGILADAMGLGKTVEMLDLILLNRRDTSEMSPCEIQTKSNANDSEDDIEQVRCLCTKSHRETVSCTRCHTLQHRLCVSQRNSKITPDSQYICPSCWQTEEPLKAKTTFIVSPPSIKLQWRDEVVKHVRDENFKVGALAYFEIT